MSEPLHASVVCQPTTAFLDEQLAAVVRAEHGPAELVIANNVYAHIPDLWASHVATGLLADDGFLSIEVHHALNLVSLGQFDTIYHEHFQYYTVLSAMRALATAGLAVVDVELIPTHGGSIRVWARPEESAGPPSERVADVLRIEEEAGLHHVDGYLQLRPRTEAVRHELLRFLLDCRAEGKRVVGYGAPGKGNTLLNYCGIRSDLLEYTVDRFCFAFAALAGTLPILLATAIAIKLTSRGPVFYSSERIGIDGRPFSMLKFRTMVQDADKQLESLLGNNESDGLLFKIREDPRVTPVGRVLRRFSIDELPQFINVLRQEMSVVGPRPPLRREVEAYDDDVQRRLLVKPGVTGLWQVSGRSDLSWDKSVRLDLSYVDNWSMVGDILIIAKTMRAVFQRKGAY